MKENKLYFIRAININQTPKKYKEVIHKLFIDSDTISTKNKDVLKYMLAYPVATTTWITLKKHKKMSTTLHSKITKFTQE